MKREIRKLKEKILYCLEHYPETRNSDIKLTNCIWVQYYQDNLFFKDEEDTSYISVKLIDIYDLPSEDNVKRLRAIIQNDKLNPKFPPTDIEVFKQRRINEKLWKEEMSYSNPSLG